MIARRKFIALGAGLTASLFAAGHSRMHMAPIDMSPVVISNTPVEHNLVPPEISTPISSPLKALRERYAPPITDHHPDNLILDQIATKPVELAAEQIQLTPPPDVVLS